MNMQHERSRKLIRIFRALVIDHGVGNCGGERIVRQTDNETLLCDFTIRVVSRVLRLSGLRGRERRGSGKGKPRMPGGTLRGERNEREIRRRRDKPWKNGGRPGKAMVTSHSVILL